MIIQILERISGKKKELDCGRHCQAVIDAMKRQEKSLMGIKMDIEALKSALDAANEKTTKIIGEIQALKDVVANPSVTLPPEVEEKVNQLLGNLQVADDQNEDATV